MWSDHEQTHPNPELHCPVRQHKHRAATDQSAVFIVLKGYNKAVKHLHPTSAKHHSLVLHLYFASRAGH